MKRVLIIGNFGSVKGIFDGQTIKTENVFKALCGSLGKENVDRLNTNGGLKRLHIIIFRTIKAAFVYDNLIMMPAQNGVKVLAPLLSVLSKISRCKIHYIVIGGWLPSFLKSHSIVKASLRYFDEIYVETTSMKADLKIMGVFNVSTLPNFKYLNTLSKKDLIFHTLEPYKLCIFSRIMKEKGIEDAIDVVKAINDKYKKTIYVLDIYGQIDPSYKDRFYSILKDSPQYIKYFGVVQQDTSPEVLKDYFLLLFPTRFYTEGIPGTVLDAYSSGVPVLCSKWKNYSDIVVEGELGYCYDFGSKDSFESELRLIYEEKILITNNMRIKCLLASQKYSPQSIINNVVQKLK